MSEYLTPGARIRLGTEAAEDRNHVLGLVARLDSRATMTQLTSAAGSVGFVGQGEGINLYLGWAKREARFLAV